MARHVFLTGPPGVGKTTLIQKASEVLKSSGVPVDGFYTQEVRQGGRRIGFDVVTLSGLRGPLSRVGAGPPPGTRECRVGQYVVDLASFEQLALPVLDAGAGSSPGPRVCVIDEVGKMELFSQPFTRAVRQTLAAPGTVVLGTIPVPKGKPLAFVEEIRSRADVQVFSVTKENRNHLLPDIVRSVMVADTWVLVWRDAAWSGPLALGSPGQAGLSDGGGERGTARSRHGGATGPRNWRLALPWSGRGCGVIQFRAFW
ncbi:cancer-related nucleoside-triphosphatase isoform X2 [Myotis myotis]|uniref:cancer-related nucleoside-triphosphatase isoform X2 n=1 Tax=Myotis myotis TaxID=51298 RepID=UPI00174DEDFE|nr:cancer-related nucleoside-triphosphatase isoform X2 [Myotis myotis]